MIVDFHTHVFPPAVIEDRDRFLRDDPTFAALYASPKAKLAGPDDLLRSMDAAGVDMSVALAFGWSDADTCRRHNDHLIESAAGCRGRIVPFGMLPLASGASAIVAEAERCIATGMRGFGELRPDSVGADTDTPEMVEALTEVAESGAVLLFHVSEPVGHTYAGKEGFALESFYRLLQALPGTRIVGAHWGGGLPFYAHMPEVRERLSSAWVDTAATSLLYAPGVYRDVAASIGAERILFGSDFPSLSQARSRRRIEEDSGLSAEDIERMLGANAQRLLGLS
jgi:predicted TIM-barrel fold metal-dependent hydrolase